MARFLKRLGFLFTLRRSIPFFVSFFFSKEVTIMKKLFFFIMIVGYILIPFDIIPDFLIGFGIIDDITVALFLLQWMVKVAPQSLKDKYKLIK